MVLDQWYVVPASLYDELVGNSITGALPQGVVLIRGEVGTLDVGIRFITRPLASRDLQLKISALAATCASTARELDKPLPPANKPWYGKFNRKPDFKKLRK